MKKYILYLLLFIPAVHYSQVIISPYILYLDQQKRFGSFIVQNESNEEFEISISFIFGHPVSDSLGNGSMKYYEEKVEGMPSIDGWIRAFPRNFLLRPKQRQVVRMTVRAPDTLEAGTYWTRVVTSSSPKSQSIQKTEGGVSARINFVINQVTTALFRKDSAWTGIDINRFEQFEDTSSVYFLTGLTRTGNSPFYGDITVSVSDTSGTEIISEQAFIAVYFDLTERISFKKEELPPGVYTADLTVNFNEKLDIPESRMQPNSPIKKTIQFEIVE